MSGVSENRPPYVPKRFNLWYGEEWPGPAFTIREADGSDVDQLRSLLRQAGHRPSDRTLRKWLTLKTFHVRLVCRNFCYAVAVCVTKTTLDGTRILALHVAPSFDAPAYNPSSTPLARTLLALAAAELPERPTTILVASADETRQELVRSAGYKFAGKHGTDGQFFAYSARLFKHG